MGIVEFLEYHMESVADQIARYSYVVARSKLDRPGAEKWAAQEAVDCGHEMVAQECEYQERIPIRFTRKMRQRIRWRVRQYCARLRHPLPSILVHRDDEGREINPPRSSVSVDDTLLCPVSDVDDSDSAISSYVLSFIRSATRDTATLCDAITTCGDTSILPIARELGYRSDGSKVYSRVGRMLADLRTDLSQAIMSGVIVDALREVAPEIRRRPTIAERMIALSFHRTRLDHVRNEGFPNDLNWWEHRQFFSFGG